MFRKQKVAFIKKGSFSHINENVYEILLRNFPDFQIDVYDVFTNLVRRKNPFIYHCLKDYGKNIFLGRKSLVQRLFHTPYAFNKIRKTFLDKAYSKNYAFTFSTGSIFDFSIPGIPHFLYTDHTHLTYRSYVGFDHRNLASKEWIEREKTIYQNASINFTMSSNISKSLINDYSIDPRKISCVNCGANVGEMQNEYIDENRYSKREILFVGIDWVRKGGPTLIEAFKRIVKTYPDVKLTIVGCKPKIDLPNCKVIGEIPLSEVGKYFQNASIFCLPTTLEPFGIVFLEAMAYKLPIIATKIGAIPDFIHEGMNGYLVDPNNPFQLSERIIDLISSPTDCIAFGNYGFDLYQNKYNWEKTGLKIYQDIKRVLIS